MWAVTSSFPFVSQPIAELVSDQPSRTSLHPYIGRPIIYRASLPDLHAIHCLLTVDAYSNVSFCLGSRYCLTVHSDVNQDAVHPFLGVNQRYLKAAIESNGSEINFRSVPLIPIGQMAVCFGYAYAASGQLQAYAHLAKVNYGYLLGLQLPPSPSCGSGTASLLVDVDADDAFTGEMQIIVREPAENVGGNIGLSGVSWHIGPFRSTAVHVQERTAAKVSRAYTQVASLRSNSTNFTTPVHFPYIGRRNPFFRFNVAPADCAGHAEFLLPQLFDSPSVPRFAPALNGQPSSDTAYVALNESAKSNCGFTVEQASSLAQIIVNVDGSFFGEAVSFTKNLASDQYGNNEYAGVSNTPGSSGQWDTIHVQVLITGEEYVDDPAFGPLGVEAITPLANVAVRFSLTVQVSMFVAQGGERTGAGVSFSKAMTEAEAENFFNGGVVSLAGGGITVSPAG